MKMCVESSLGRNNTISKLTKHVLFEFQFLSSTLFIVSVRDLNFNLNIKKLCGVTLNCLSLHASEQTSSLLQTSILTELNLN